MTLWAPEELSFDKMSCVLVGVSGRLGPMKDMLH